MTGAHTCTGVSVCEAPLRCYYAVEMPVILGHFKVTVAFKANKCSFCLSLVHAAVSRQDLQRLAAAVWGRGADTAPSWIPASELADISMSQVTHTLTCPVPQGFTHVVP